MIHTFAEVSSFFPEICYNVHLLTDMKKFWVCRVCSGERFSVTEVEIEESGTIADLKRTVIAALNIKSVEMCVMFEGKCCPSESKLSAYVERISKSSPIELSWGKIIVLIL